MSPFFFHFSSSESLVSCWKKPSAPCLSSFITSRFSHSISRVCALNKKQLVCGVSLRAWLCVHVRLCDIMATALIVWHRAAAAFCQKSSSDSPTGMMAHLTNASPQEQANNADPSSRRNNGWGAEVGWDHIRLVPFNSTDPNFGMPVKKMSPGPLQHPFTECFVCVGQ